MVAFIAVVLWGAAILNMGFGQAHQQPTAAHVWEAKANIRNAE